MLTTCSVYRAHEKIMLQVELYLKSQDISIQHYEDQKIYQRIAQRISSISADEYTKHVDLNGINAKENLSLQYLEISTQTGKCSVKARYFAKGFFDFFSMWLYFLLILLSAFFTKKNKISSAVLLFDLIPNIEKTDLNFVDFCKNGKITPLQTSASIVARVKKLPKVQMNPNKHVYTKRHPIEFCVAKLLNKRQLLVVFVEHLFLPFLFFKLIISNRLNFLISQDIALIKIVSFLNKNSIIESMIITTSWFQSQPIWMTGLRGRNFKSHMLWYSQNFIPKVYKGDVKPSNLPSARMMLVDEHWIWTKGFANYLKGLGQTSKINVVGPILWFLRKNHSIVNDDFQIVLFDVTPKDDKNPFAAQKNYYSVKLMKKFISDNVEICKKLSEKYAVNIAVLLKHKRVVDSTHSTEYIEFIDEMVGNNDIKLLDPDINTFSIIDECLISISVPYTSTAYVAAHLKKDAIYYDPLAEIEPFFEENKHVSFISSDEDLENIVEAAVIKKLKCA